MESGIPPFPLVLSVPTGGSGALHSSRWRLLLPPLAFLGRMRTDLFLPPQVGKHQSRKRLQEARGQATCRGGLSCSGGESAGTAAGMQLAKGGKGQIQIRGGVFCGRRGNVSSGSRPVPVAYKDAGALWAPTHGMHWQPPQGLAASFHQSLPLD